MNVRDGLVALQTEDLSHAVRLTRRKLELAGKEVHLDDQEAERALKQYYALPLLEYPRQRFAISSVVDEYWHGHVLNTREYRDFCHRVYGCFMHHVPLNPDDQVDFLRVRNLYKETRRLLVKNFGRAVSETAYPIIRGSGKDVVICTFDYCIAVDMFDAPSKLGGGHESAMQVA